MRLALKERLRGTRKWFISLVRSNWEPGTGYEISKQKWTSDTAPFKNCFLRGFQINGKQFYMIYVNIYNFIFFK